MKPVIKNMIIKYIALCSVFILFVLSGCGNKPDAEIPKNTTKESITSVSQLNDPSYTIGVGMGDTCELMAKEAFPNAKFAYLDNVNLFEALTTKKIDALAIDQVYLETAV